MPHLEIRLLGYPSVHFDGRVVDLSLRKGLGLLAYLADHATPVGRDDMAGLLWPEADTETARSRLRRTLHRIRAAFASEIVVADRTALRLAPQLHICVDVHAFKAACEAGNLSEAAGLYGRDFLTGFSIDGCSAFEEWAFFRREALRSQLVWVLERHIEHELARNNPLAAIPAATRLVGLDPLSETAQRHLIAAYLQAGNRAAAERQYEICARLLDSELGVGPDPQTRALLERPPGCRETPAEDRTRYVECDGVHLAYQVVGEGPIDIVLVPGFVSHVERIWDEPRSRSVLTTLSQMGRLVLFDRRGIGLSDRVGAAPTVAATANDLLTVLDAVRSRCAILIGASEGGPGCIQFAATHPERLAGLVLYGSMAKGSRSSDYQFALTRAQYDAWLNRLVHHWGGAAEIATFAPGLVGDRQAECWWSSLLRAASSPGAIKAVLESLRDTDVRSLLPHISTPSLILHRRGDRAVRVEAGRHLAEFIPGARLVEFEGADHWLWAGDYHLILDQIRMFCAEVGHRAASR